jgi:hypothetical protein
MPNTDTFWNHFRANAYLAYRAVFFHPLKKLLSRDTRTGMEKFLANYGAEGLVPTTDADRLVLRGASRCIHCGLCDVMDAVLSVAARRDYDGMSRFPVAYTRASGDAPWVLQAATLADDAALARGEAVCPTGVPLRALAAYLRRKAGEVSRAMAP